MMLMLIVAEKIHDGSLKLTDKITTSRKAAEMGGSQVYLKENETFSLDDMMKAVVVHSANDASVAVAEYIAGSTESFVVMMNQQAAALGMKDSHYYSANGLPPAKGEPPDVASAYDQAILARELLKYPDVIRWASIDTAPFRAGTFMLRNTNHMVRTYQGCDGLKTGFYDKAGFNVVATAKRNDLRLIAVVLGSQHKLTNFKEASEMLSQGFLNYEMHPIAKKGAPIAQSVRGDGRRYQQYQADLGPRRWSLREARRREKRDQSRLQSAAVDRSAAESGTADRNRQRDRRRQTSRHDRIARTVRRRQERIVN